MPSTGFLPGSSLFPAQEPALCTLQITPRGFPGGIWGDLAPKEIPKLLGGGGRRGWMTQGAGELPAGWGEERPRTKPYRTKPYRTKPFLSCPAKAQSCFGLALKGESQAGHPKTRC